MLAMFEELAFPGGRLRAWSHTDAPVLVSAWADEQVSEWNAVPAEPTVETAQRWIQGHEERLQRRLALDAVIVDQADHVVGEVGLSGFNEAHAGALIGYWLLPQARGRGVASAAVSAMCEWAHTTLELDVIVAKCHESNPASQAVAQRSGFTYGATDPSGYQLWRSRGIAAS